jgi:Bacterial regulatory helix-turn-helix protein, lysR family
VQCALPGPSSAEVQRPCRFRPVDKDVRPGGLLTLLRPQTAFFSLICRVHANSSSSDFACFKCQSRAPPTPRLDQRSDWIVEDDHHAVASGGPLGVNQSTVRRRLTELENRLGQQLIERHRGGYRLTKLGEQLRPDAECIEAAVAAFELLRTSGCRPRPRLCPRPRPRQFLQCDPRHFVCGTMDLN